jgi:UDP-N-acetylglucosamine 1-carboxyvinyltransferase
MRADSLRGRPIFLDEASVMATENAIMAAVLAEGETVIGNAACEPHVQDLCNFLVSLGARIGGIGSNILTIAGVDRLHGGDYRIGPEHIEVASFIGLAAVTGADITIEDAAPEDLVSIIPAFERLGGGEHRIAPEHIEVASFIGLAAVTGGDLTIEDTAPEDLISILPAFARLGVQVEVEESRIHVPPGQELVVQDDLGGQIPKIEDGPWPAFPADLTSIALTVATQARGTVLIFEKMFESRLFFVDKLVGMGARIILCDPHRAVVTGPAQLYGERLESPDIRAGMAMLIAALAAEGTSVIGNIRQIDRGYERIDERLRALGASIERVDD